MGGEALALHIKSGFNTRLGSNTQANPSLKRGALGCRCPALRAACTQGKLLWRIHRHAQDQRRLSPEQELRLPAHPGSPPPTTTTPCVPLSGRPM